MSKRRARVVHHVKGRIRVKLPDAKGDHHFLERLQQSLSPMAGVRSVDVNPATASIVVHYDPTAHLDFYQTLADHGENEGLFFLESAKLSEVDEIANELQREAQFLAQHSHVAKSAVDSVSRIDQALKKATNNTVDLKVLLPLGLAIYSFLELESEIATPLWVTLGIFSFNSFVALHHPGGHRMEMNRSEVIPTPMSRESEGNTAIRKRTRKRS